LGASLAKTGFAQALVDRGATNLADLLSAQTQALDQGAISLLTFSAYILEQSATLAYHH